MTTLVTFNSCVNVVFYWSFAHSLTQLLPSCSWVMWSQSSLFCLFLPPSRTLSAWRVLSRPGNTLFPPQLQLFSFKTWKALETKSNDRIPLDEDLPGPHSHRGALWKAHTVTLIWLPGPQLAHLLQEYLKEAELGKKEKGGGPGTRAALSSPVPSVCL